MDTDECLRTVLIEIKKFSNTADKKTVYKDLKIRYDHYRTIKARGLHAECNVPDNVDDCDVVDTCSCHFDLNIYPANLLNDCIRVYQLIKPFGYTPTFHATRTGLPRKTSLTRFRRLAKCFFTCSMSSDEPRQSI